MTIGRAALEDAPRAGLTGAVSSSISKTPRQQPGQRVAAVPCSLRDAHIFLSNNTIQYQCFNEAMLTLSVRENDPKSAVFQGISTNQLIRLKKMCAFISSGDRDHSVPAVSSKLPGRAGYVALRPQASPSTPIVIIVMTVTPSGSG